MGRPAADIVTVSRHHPHHDHTAGVRGRPIVIDGPGEYEIRGVQLFGLSSPLPRAPGENGEQSEGPPERNTAFLVEAEGLHIAHLGGGSVLPGAEGAELLSNVDILIVAIDGDEAIDPEAAARTVRNLEPKIVIPVSLPGAQRQRQEVSAGRVPRGDRADRRGGAAEAEHPGPRARRGAAGGAAGGATSLGARPGR